MHSVWHPQWRCAELLSANRWQMRRRLLGQTLFYGLISIGAVLLLAWQLRMLLLPHLDLIWRSWQAQASGIALVAAGYCWLAGKAALQRALLQFQDGPFAALPVADAEQQRWLHHLAWRRLGWHLLALAALAGLLYSPGITASVRIALIGTAALAICVGHLLARLSVRIPGPLETARAHAVQTIGRPWVWLSAADLPHLPVLQVQFGTALWWAGRARLGLLVLVLMAPREAMAVLVPILGMALWYGASQLEAMHRSLFALHDLLAAYPLSGGRLLRAAWRAPALLMVVLASMLAALLGANGAPWPLLVATIALLAAMASIDLLWCLRFRDQPGHGQRVRLVSAVLVLIVLQQWPIGVLPLLAVLLWRASRGLSA